MDILVSHSLLFIYSLYLRFIIVFFATPWTRLSNTCKTGIHFAANANYFFVFSVTEANFKLFDPREKCFDYGSYFRQFG